MTKVSRNGRNTRFARQILPIMLFLGISILPVTAQVHSISSVAQTVSSPTELVQRGKNYYEQGQYRDAIEVLRQASNDFELDKQTLNLIMALSNLSLAYQQEGQWHEARQAINKALGQRSKLDLSNSTSYAKLFAQALLVKGQLELATGQSEKALQSWQEASTTFSQIEDTIGKQKSQLYQVSALQELGFHRQAFKILVGIPELFQDGNPSQAIAYRSLGNLIRLIGSSENLEELEKLMSLPKGEAIKTTESKSAKATIKYLDQSRLFLNKSLEIAESVKWTPKVKQF